MSRILVVTNDFPTRQGGIESFVFALAERIPSHEIVVYTATMPEQEGFDARLQYPVYRDPSPVLLPTRGVAQRTVAALQETGCTSVLFGAAAPLGLLADRLRAAGAERVVGMTHGHETWWARVPGARRSLRRIGDACDVLTYVSEFCRRRVMNALSPDAAARMVRLAPGVDTEVFRPDSGGAQVRRWLGIGDERRVLLSVSRFVARKGQDMLIRAMPEILPYVPEAVLVLVGDGPYRRHLQRLARWHRVERNVIFTGAVPWSEAPAWFDAADVFAMPCRTRLGGLEPEALGIVFLESQATGRPVLVGDSGGAPETVRHGDTGYVVDPTDPSALAEHAVSLLSDRHHARDLGMKGREWVQREWSWEASVDTLRSVLTDP
ncbi:glycosyltransferase family 1 protein [Actinobacteria bacterium YIM 96077]|uniref:Alpha-(1-2)-phosphatidylinositol mannosyltransferase n=1 Tax=Phytoactinopolyspora halophila TaxID=1981511 RepID=A0A329QGY6_9ACTN|nr:glycosyltransferase family 4 protein [Phytoactinopolyspora halophila]AYY13667.1 glycosyltransferase family 1 protein [Actinobacteria bacterium YIM 96077]RAW11231.1 alpha-(1-2)-phosphatidylinositol mannosyltransferase [Phytoactinopolyspora halophila]